VGRPRARRCILGLGFVLLVCVTAIVFMMFDRNSHSASDTLRPFIVVMAPVWLIALAVVRRSGSTGG
jgi:heme/copper-type cytochrome/quinol oxidase subunit 4